MCSIVDDPVESTRALESALRTLCTPNIALVARQAARRHKRGFGLTSADGVATAAAARLRMDAAVKGEPLLLGLTEADVSSDEDDGAAPTVVLGKCVVCVGDGNVRVVRRCCRLGGALTVPWCGGRRARYGEVIELNDLVDEHVDEVTVASSGGGADADDTGAGSDTDSDYSAGEGAEWLETLIALDLCDPRAGTVAYARRRGVEAAAGW